MEILYAGINKSSSDNEIKFNGVCGALLIRCASGTTATVFIDGRNDRPFTIKSIDVYDQLPLTASRIQITAGNIDFLAIA